MAAAAQPVWAAPAALKTLHGHVPEVARRLKPKGSLPGTQQLSLAIGLPVSDEAGLSNYLQRVYDPFDPLYHQFLTQDQFATRFGPTPSQYEQVVAFAQKNHLTIAARHPNRLLLDVNGSVSDIQRAFNIVLRTFKHPTEARDFYAPDSEPTVDVQVPIVDVSGLNNYILPQPKSLKLGPAPGVSNPVAHSGSGPGGTYLGKDFRAAYLPGVSLTGAGQTLGLVQFDGFYPSDISAYESTAGLPQVPLQTVLLDGYSGVPTVGSRSGSPEVSLDIEMAVSMAPGLSKILVFEAGPNGLQNDILSAMATHTEAKQLSCSWGWSGGPSTTTDNLFKELAAQGQSFFSASGDSDAFPAGAVDDPSQANAPSSCPYITVVGGTSLTTAGSGAWASESVWNRGGGIGSSGGISSYYNLPSWQAGLSLSAAAGSTAYRNTPDVACVAEGIYVAYGNGTNGTFGGTSCAAPLWAGLAALMNQQAASLSRSPIGFINPAIYRLAQSGSYNLYFHDITAGDSTWSGSPSAFKAVPGYDLCTGWGTPAGPALISALAGPSDPLSISASPGLAADGPLGGPFSPATGRFVLTNSGAAAVTWSLVNTSVWFNVVSTGGTLPPGGTAEVNVALSPAASLVSEGAYRATLVFSNATSHAAQSAWCTLAVGQSLVQNGGFETGDFTGWTLAGHTVINSASSGPTVYNAVESDTAGYQVAHSGTYGAFLGDTQVATLSQVVPTLPGHSYLLSFWLNNPTAGTGQHFLVNWNTNTASANTIYRLDNPPVLGWTNLQFVLPAPGNSAVLQVGAENDSAGFGLDDVSLKPLPALGFATVSHSAAGCDLGWLSAMGVRYQVQYTTDLVPGPWTNLGSSVTGTGGPLTVTDPASATAAAHRFYRLTVLP